MAIKTSDYSLGGLGFATGQNSGTSGQTSLGDADTTSNSDISMSEFAWDKSSTKELDETRFGSNIFVGASSCDPAADICVQKSSSDSTSITGVLEGGEDINLDWTGSINSEANTSGTLASVLVEFLDSSNNVVSSSSSTKDGSNISGSFSDGLSATVPPETEEIKVTREVQANSVFTGTDISNCDTTDCTNEDARIDADVSIETSSTGFNGIAGDSSIFVGEDTPYVFGIAQDTPTYDENVQNQIINWSTSNVDFVVESAADAKFDGFEDGNWNPPWTENQSPQLFIETSSSRVWSGQYSGNVFSSSRVLGPMATWTFSTSNYDFVEVYWQESSNQFGHLINVLNADGDRMIGGGSDNPQWIVYNEAGATTGRTELFDGDPSGGTKFNKWVRMRFDFLADGTVDVSFKDIPTGTTASQNFTLQNQGEIGGVEIDNVDKFDDDNGQHWDSWYDNIRVGKSDPLTITAFSENTFTNATIDVTFNDGYNVDSSETRNLSVDSNIRQAAYLSTDNGSVVKLDSTGSFDWSTSFAASSVNDVAVDFEGVVYSAASDGEINATNTDGTPRWSFNGHTSSAEAVTVDSNGFVYTASSDNTVRKLDDSGNEEWSHSYTQNGTDVIQDVAVGSGGDVYIVGRGTDESNEGGGIRRLNSSGSEIWTADINNYSIELGIDSDGDAYIVYAFINQNTTFPNINIVKYTDTGSVSWTETYGDFSTTPYPTARDVALPRSSGSDVYFVFKEEADERLEEFPQSGSTRSDFDDAQGGKNKLALNDNTYIHLGYDDEVSDNANKYTTSSPSNVDTATPDWSYTGLGSGVIVTGIAASPGEYHLTQVL